MGGGASHCVSPTVQDASKMSLGLTFEAIVDGCGPMSQALKITELDFLPHALWAVPGWTCLQDCTLHTCWGPQPLDFGRMSS